MSHYICPNCNHKSHIFKSDGAEKVAKEYGIKVVANIPLNENICLQSDLGKPIVVSDPDSQISKDYFDIAKAITSFEKMQHK